MYVFENLLITKVMYTFLILLEKIIKKIYILLNISYN